MFAECYKDHVDVILSRLFLIAVFIRNTLFKKNKDRPYIGGINRVYRRSIISGACNKIVLIPNPQPGFWRN